MRQHALSDEEWAFILPLLPKNVRGSILAAASETQDGQLMKIWLQTVPNRNVIV